MRFPHRLLSQKIQFFVFGGHMLFFPKTKKNGGNLGPLALNPKKNKVGWCPAFAGGGFVDFGGALALPLSLCGYASATTNQHKSVTILTTP